MPIEIAIAVKGAPAARIQHIEVKSARETFSLPLDQEPLSVSFDPRTFVLMEAEVSKLDKR
jgi:hypothetical protein